MEAILEKISKQQKETWNKFSPGWKKWDSQTMDFLKPVGDKIVSLLNLKIDDLVLDVASGTGEPGLTIANNVKYGKVILTDISESMLETAAQKAAKAGISNIEIINNDVSNLPFKDNIFDSVSCRFGFMFFPDMLLAAKEMVRVLKPGGRIAVSVWNVPEKNFWASAILDTIKTKVQQTQPAPDAPGLFRCAADGLMFSIFEKSGLKNIYQEEVPGKLKINTVSNYWKYMTEVAAPVVDALRNIDLSSQCDIRAEVFMAVSKKYKDGNVNFDSSAIVISGEK